MKIYKVYYETFNDLFKTCIVASNTSSEAQEVTKENFKTYLYFKTVLAIEELDITNPSVLFFERETCNNERI